ncbi:MAG: glycoside hydrolase family 1 protein [Anaerolineae bacterium]|nr:glycoside hydrolase family 1 protein [Anaerolineae bacterium]
MTTRKHLPYRFDVDLTGFRLPEGFLFGVCNSPYHVEGFYNHAGAPFNQWGRWELDGIVETSGEANDFWNRYRAHIDKAKALGLNAFRMGFDWTRVQPTYQPDAGTEPPFDPSAFDRYADIVAAIYDAGMEPVITIYHFIQPAWVGVNLWIEDALVEKFMAYAATTVYEVNRRLVDRGYPAIWFWVTFNEPGIPPQCNYLNLEHPHDPATAGMDSAVTNQDNILACHVKLYGLIHEMYRREGWRTPHVGFNTVANSLYEFDKGLYDLCRAREHGVMRDALPAYFDAQRQDFYAYYNRIADRRLGAISEKRLDYEHSKHDATRDFNPLKFTRAIDALYASQTPQNMDYVAINIYDPFLAGVKYEKPAGAEISIAEPANRPGWWDWDHERKTYEDHLELYGRDTLGLPLYILEASIGHKQPLFGKAEPRPDGLTRIQYLKETLGEVMRAIQKGYPVRGYLYWTLADNYEWGTYTVRLGLLEYDFANHVICDTDAFGLPTGQTYAALIAAMRSGDPVALAALFGSLETVSG